VRFSESVAFEMQFYHLPGKYHLCLAYHALNKKASLFHEIAEILFHGKMVLIDELCFVAQKETDSGMVS